LKEAKVALKRLATLERESLEKDKRIAELEKELQKVKKKRKDENKNCEKEKNRLRQENFYLKSQLGLPISSDNTNTTTQQGEQPSTPNDSNSADSRRR
jgi:hypothetical protein